MSEKVIICLFITEQLNEDSSTGTMNRKLSDDNEMTAPKNKGQPTNCESCSKTSVLFLSEMTFQTHVRLDAVSFPSFSIYLLVGHVLMLFLLQLLMPRSQSHIMW